jgi:hypothetical protein
VLGTPVNKKVQVDIQLKNQLTKYFAVVYDDILARDIPKQIDFGSVIRYGRLRIADGGDRVRTASAVDANRDSRDNSYVKVSFFFPFPSSNLTLLFNSMISSRTSTPHTETDPMFRSDELSMVD